MACLDFSEKIQQNFESKKNYSLFMGILHILDKAFLLLVNEILPVCNIENNDIFVIASVSFIPFEVYFIISYLFSSLSNRMRLTSTTLKAERKPLTIS